MDFKESQTYHNLESAYHSELMASTKYLIYGLKACEDEYHQISNVFEETSKNEREHAKIWLKLLHDGEVPPTLTNIREAARGENQKWMSVYPEYAETARKEGYPEIAKMFEDVSIIENNHDARFETLAWNIESNQVFRRENEAVWICMNCGNLVWAKGSPDTCPVCSCPQGYYQLFCEPF